MFSLFLLGVSTLYVSRLPSSLSGSVFVSLSLPFHLLLTLCMYVCVSLPLSLPLPHPPLSPSIHLPPPYPLSLSLISLLISLYTFKCVQWILIKTSPWYKSAMTNGT